MNRGLVPRYSPACSTVISGFRAVASRSISRADREVMKPSLVVRPPVVLRSDPGEVAIPQYRGDASMVGIDELDQGGPDLRQIAVVDPPVVQLTDKLAEQPGPVPASRCDRCRNLHLSLDDLDGRVSRGRGSRLLPRTVTAGGRTPLRDRTAAAQRDRTTAPAARCCGGTP